jgi:hypothetical protein
MVMAAEFAGLSDMARVADVLISRYYFSRSELNKLCISTKRSLDNRINDQRVAAKSYILNLSDRNPVHFNENGKLIYLLACGFEPIEIIQSAAYDIDNVSAVDI